MKKTIFFVDVNTAACRDFKFPGFYVAQHYKLKYLSSAFINIVLSANYHYTLLSLKSASKMYSKTDVELICTLVGT